jgi:hypothetical protein
VDRPFVICSKLRTAVVRAEPPPVHWRTGHTRAHHPHGPPVRSRSQPGSHTR